MLEQQRDALRSQPLDLEEFERGRRELLQQQIAALAGAAPDDLFENEGQAFADAGDAGDLALRVLEDVFDPLGMAFDSGSAVAVTADAERIFSGDLHQIGGFPEDARYLLVLHPRSILALAFRSNPTALCGARSHRNSRTPGGRRGLRSKLRYKLLRTRPDSSWVYVAGGRPGGGLRIVGLVVGLFENSPSASASEESGEGSDDPWRRLLKRFRAIIGACGGSTHARLLTNFENGLLSRLSWNSLGFGSGLYWGRQW